jgi:hypothetical protein
LFQVDSSLKLSEDAVTTIALDFSSATVTLIRDVETLTLHELIRFSQTISEKQSEAMYLSSIGGQTGLWLGASVVTVCQLLSSLLCPCLHWSNLRTGYNSFRKTIRRPKRSKAATQGYDEV